jgi:PH (Pleckstrin Homology) domain-containing protein
MITDANLPQAFHAVKDKDEKFIWVGMPARLPFVVRGIPFFVFGCLWGAFDYFGFIRHMGGPHGIPLGFAIPFFALHLFPFWAGVGNLIRLFLVMGRTYYAVTNKRMMLSTGFWGSDFKTIDLNQLAGLDVSVNPIERMQGVGSIRAFSGALTSRGRPIFDTFVGIGNPYEVFKKINDASGGVKTNWSYMSSLVRGAPTVDPTSKGT